MKEFLYFQSALGSRLVSVAEVVEVIPMVALQKESLENKLFCGLLNYRGQIVPVFDFADGSTQRTLDPQAFLIVTQYNGKPVALLAQEVNQIIAITSEDISLIAPAGAPSFSVAKLGDEMIRIVCPKEFLGA